MELDALIQTQLDNFGSLLSKYAYGESLVAENGGHHIDKGL